MVKRPILSALRVAQDANAAAYRHAVQGGAAGECWDYLVLTATNEKQAAGYRQELALRQRAVGPAGAFFPAFQKCVVVSDPPGPRIGSGGATLHALRALVTEHGVPAGRLPELRILLIHSGGLSQRLPAYSPLGKIFSPLPLMRPDGQVATLFDHLYVTLAGLPERLGPGMLVLSGDVFLLFDHRHVSTPPAGVTALTFRVDPEVAAAHGVFVTEGPSHAVRKTLQKVSPQQMRVEGAIDAHGKVLIDTGLLFFDPERTKALARLAGLGVRKGRPAQPLHVRHATPLDLYVDVVTALSAGGRRGDTRMLKELAAAFRGTDFRAMVLDGEFLHLGTTQQFRDAMTGRSASPVADLLQQNVLVHAPAPLPADCRAFHAAFLGDSASARPAIGAGSLVESSILGVGSRIGSNCVVSQTFADGWPLRVADGMLFFQVPLRTKGGRRFAQVLCGVTDDFKGSFAAGECRFLNAPLERWLALHGIMPEDLWPAAGERTLWTARLFPATGERARADAVAWFQLLSGAPARVVGKWRRAERYSMSMILDHADPVAMIEHRESVTALVQAGYLLDSIRAGENKSIDEMLPHYATAAAYRLATERLAAFGGEAGGTPAELLHRARAAWSVSQLARRPNHPDGAFARAHAEPFAVKSFATIAAASEAASVSVRVGDGGPAGVGLRAGRVVTASSPVRLDLAGGWSDTPPYCYERGGHVVNVAVDLDGRPPIVATVRTLAEPKIVLASRDLGQTAELTRGIDGAVDVRDPFALHKVALQLVGLTRRGGVGLEVVTESRLPKGSGLGTSSILAATLLAALNRLVGRRVSASGLFDQTLLLEQRLSTGGGWQDQVGGIVGGVKSTVTGAGLPQRMGIERLELSEGVMEGFEERLVVYYSGQQRLARDILRRVMGRWLSREPAVVAVMERLKRCSADLRGALLKGRWPGVAEGIDRYWRIKKELYPGSTTPSVDVMMLELRGHYAAASLAGAGGGGFAYFFCRDGRQARRLTEMLAERSARPGSLGAVYPSRINRRGLVVKEG